MEILHHPMLHHGRGHIWINMVQEVLRKQWDYNNAIRYYHANQTEHARLHMELAHIQFKLCSLALDDFEKDNLGKE